ncbi:MAG: HEAT repeat domain-containing protein [Kofleriaceae bacterium]
MRFATSSTLTLLALASGCGQDATSPDEDSPAAHWRASITSDDPLERAKGADAVLGDPLAKAEGIEALEKLAYDSDARVREQAVLAYGQLAGRDAVKLLKEIALGDESDDVGAAARASLDRIAIAFPVPKRGWLQVELPETFDTKRPFPIHVRFGSSAEVPRARVTVQLPQGLAMADRTLEPQWIGALKAGEIHDQTFDVVAMVAELHTGTRVHLKLDYPEALDSERFHERVRVVLDGGRGHFEPLPAIVSTP